MYNRGFITEIGSYDMEIKKSLTVCHMQADEQERCMCVIQSESEDLSHLKY